MFCPELQKLLKPIYDLTRKGKPFYWGKEQQDSFVEIKHRLMKLPVLHMPNKTGRFHLYSDTSKFVTGSALCQIQGGKPKLIAYASKRLPEAAKNYSITELELCGLAINIASFAHLLKRADFDTIVDHLALTHIIKSKVEPATTRIKRLLELISSYSFNLYYMKGREKYLIQTCSQAKTSSTKLLEVHRVRKELNPNLRLEKQHAMPKQGITEKLQMGQRRVGLRRRRPEPDYINQPSDVTGRISGGSKIVTGKTNSSRDSNGVQGRAINNDKPFSPDVLLHPYPLHKPSPIQQNTSKVGQTNQNASINLDFEENSPFQEGIISETIHRPDKLFFQNPIKLEDLIDMGNLIHKFLPRQTYIVKILHII